MTVRQRDAPSFETWTEAGKLCRALHDDLNHLHTHLANRCLTHDDPLLGRLDQLRKEFKQLRSDLDTVCNDDLDRRGLSRQGPGRFPIYPGAEDR